MPQASDELREKFPGYDAEALEVIAANFTETRGLIRRKSSSYLPNQREWDAVDYLIQEWDYVYSCEDGQPERKVPPAPSYTAACEAERLRGELKKRRK